VLGQHHAATLFRHLGQTLSVFVSGMGAVHALVTVSEDPSSIPSGEELRYFNGN